MPSGIAPFPEGFLWGTATATPTAVVYDWWGVVRPGTWH